MPPRPKKTLASRPSASTSTQKRRRRAPSPPPSPPFEAPFPWPTRNIQQLDRCKILCNRAIVPTRYVDDFTITHLGIRQEIHQILNTVGWTQLAGFRHPTYMETTLEFLSSLNSTFTPYTEHDDRCVHFRLMGDEHHISLADFNNIFNLPNEGATWYPTDFNCNQAWNRLAIDDSDYNPSSSKSTKLQSLVMRYIHRLIVHAIRAKGESTGVVGKPELFMLSSFAYGTAINTGAWMLKHIIAVSKRPKGKICIGGLISAIYLHYGYHLDEDNLTLVTGPNKIDLNTLGKMGMVAYTGEGQYVFVDAAGRPIPADEPVEDEPENLEADPDVATDEEAEENIPQPSAPQTSAPSSSTQPPWEIMLAQLERLSTASTNHTESLARLEERISRMDDRLSRIEHHYSRD